MVYADFSISLDGFVAGPRIGVDNPMGDGGEALHDWMFSGKSPEEVRAFQDEKFATTGAFIMGRTMFDLGVGPWGENPPFHAPVFVVTHRAAAPIVKQRGTTYTFVADGPSAALEAARAAAGERDICVAGGAAAVQHYSNEGVIDELRLQLVPILLGGGVRLAGFDRQPAQLELKPGVSAEGNVVHLRYRLR
jgi:dihydrofolate reductase